MENKLVIFDLDGTLIDSVYDIQDSLNYTLERFGFAKINLTQTKKFIGNGARKLVERSLGDFATEENIDKVLKFYNEYYTKSGSPKTKLFDGIGDMLIDLKNKGYKLAILTNKPQMTTEDVYETYLKQYNFDMVCGQSEFIKCKPDKSGVMHILEKLNVSPENTYFVGDGETDVMTAKNSQIKGISALWGYREKEILSSYGATIFADAPSSIKDLVK